jgi:LysM repeat protein
MARTSTSRRRERDTDPMDSLKPLIVLGLLGTIMYGAYSVVQKGPAPAPAGSVVEAGSTFAPPEISLPRDPTAIGVAPAHPLAGAEPLLASAVPAGAALPPSLPAVAPPPPALPAIGSLRESAPLLPVASPPPATLDPQAAIEPLAAAAEAGALSPPPPAPLPPAPLPLAAAPPSRGAPSPAFASAWADAHEMLGAGRYAEALSVLSLWHDDATLGLEESQRLEDLLGQLAGTVIYSQKDLLLPPHIVAPGDTLPSIAAPLQVPWQLLAKINGVSDPSQLVPGEHLKVVRGPFDAVISVSRRRMSLQVGGNYAGSFPVVLGRQIYDRVGQSVGVIDIRRPGAAQEPTGIAAQVAYAPSAGPKSIILGEGLAIEGVEDPSLVSDSASASSVIVSLRDLEDIADILGPGSQVLVRK